jgi:hypothetical protein
MAAEERHGQLVYSECGRFKDLEHGESGFLEMTRGLVGIGEDGEEDVLGVLGRLTGWWGAVLQVTSYEGKQHGSKKTRLIVI